MAAPRAKEASFGAETCASPGAVGGADLEFLWKNGDFMGVQKDFNRIE